MLTIIGYCIVIVGFCVVLAALGFLLLRGIRSTMRMSRRSTAVQRHAGELMAGRTALTHSEFGSRFFPPDQAETASRLREILARILILDVTRVHPDDRLIEDLGLGQVDGLAPNFLEFDVGDGKGTVPFSRRETCCPRQRPLRRENWDSPRPGQSTWDQFHPPSSDTFFRGLLREAGEDLLG